MKTRTPSNLLPLMKLGFTELEAEVYVYLLQNSPATGYRVASSLSRPTANTYKALERLIGKGAVVVAHGERRMCRAVKVNELLRSFNKRFKSNCEEVEGILAELETPDECDLVYRLQTADQIHERFRQLLRDTESVAVLDLFPGPAEKLKADIESAIRRNVRIVLKLYQPMDVPKASVVISTDSGVLDRWPGVWANGVFDGKRHILSLTSRDLQHVHYAIWSTNPYVSWVYHSSLVQELVLAVMETPTHKKGSLAARIAATCEQSCPEMPTVPGYLQLISKLTDYEKNFKGIETDAKYPAQPR
jgi:sugar-specific transcriptional regulator TrmB